MTGLRSVPCAAVTTVSATGWLRHVCPYVEEVDDGTVTVSWRCDGATVELHSLAAYLRTWARQKISHEEVIQRIAADVGGLEGVTDVVVGATFTTANLEVKVSGCST